MSIPAKDKPIGVFGGTFDPVHFGHLRPALELLEQLELEAIHLIPCAVPPHRGEPHATAAQRLEMLALAVADEPRLRVDDRELKRPGPSYMVDTLASLRGEYGAQRPLCLLLGVDAFLGLPSWYHWQKLIALAHIVVAHRPGWRLDEASVQGPLQQMLDAHLCSDPSLLQHEPAGRLLLQPVTQLAISATDIRRRIGEGGSANYLVPAAVWHYIAQHHLYC